MAKSFHSSDRIEISGEKLSDFSSDVEALWSTPIKELTEVPSPLTFLRDHVSLSKPLLIRNAFPTLALDDLVDEGSNDDILLNVDVSDGHGDCIRVVNGERIFVMPQVKQMTLNEFREGLKRQKKYEDPHDSVEKDDRGLRKINDDDENGAEIYYYSRQNDCLRSELPSLAKLFPKTIQFADETFNAKPEAVNLWIGNEKSVSSLHKDHYENIFCVACGEKVFTVCPPSDALYMEEATLPSGTFCKDTRGTWTVNRDKVEENGELKDQMVRWLDVDVEKLLSSDADRQKIIAEYPLLQHAHPMRIHVRAGDMLYLPSLWYHRVTQTCETVAVNYWYDMRFDSPLFCYFNFFQNISQDKEMDDQK